MSMLLTPEMLSTLDSKTVAKLHKLVNPDAVVEKPKRVLTPEHLAALAAGREAKKAAKAALLAQAELAATTPATQKPELNLELVVAIVEATDELASAGAHAPLPASPKSEGESVASPPAKKRGPKKLADMTPEELEAHKAKVAERKAAKEAKEAVAEPVAEPVAAEEVNETKVE